LNRTSLPPFSGALRTSKALPCGVKSSIEAASARQVRLSETTTISELISESLVAVAGSFRIVVVVTQRSTSAKGSGEAATAACSRCALASSKAGLTYPSYSNGAAAASGVDGGLLGPMQAEDTRRLARNRRIEQAMSNGRATSASQ